jgi:hypothetical protein
LAMGSGRQDDNRVNVRRSLFASLVRLPATRGQLILRELPTG